jgi:hypothetical protein
LIPTGIVTGRSPERCESVAELRVLLVRILNIPPMVNEKGENVGGQPEVLSSRSQTPQNHLGFPEDFLAPVGISESPG